MNVPSLRFPEYEGEWPSLRIGNFLSERATSPDEGVPLYSLTIEFGVVPKSARYEREFLVKDGKSAYKLMLEGDFAFNPMNLRFGALGRHKGALPVKVSKYYNIFSFSDEASKEFFEAYLLTNKMIGFYNKMATGSLSEKRRVHYLDFVDFCLPTPSLPEQKKIAAFLGVVDTKIAALRDRVAGLERYKRGLMQALFSQTLRFTKPNGSAFPDWEGTLFSDVAALSKQRLNPATTSEKPPLIELENLQSEMGAIIGLSDLEGQLSQKTRFQSGDVLFGKLRPYLRKFARPNFDGVCSSEIWVLRGKKVSNSFLFYLVQGVQFSQLANISAGSKMPRSDWKTIADSEFEIPHPDEQAKIAEALQAMDAKIAVVTGQLEKMQDFKKGLLQQMFV